jgi:CRISPR-associated protein Cas2
MWVVAFFDLPTETKKHRKAYRQFRDFLLGEGFLMLQYSVYVRSCSSFEMAEKHVSRIEGKVPEEGEVRLLVLTSMQYARMKCFLGKARSEPEKPPDQLSFF